VTAKSLRDGFERLLEAIAVVLMIVLTAIIVAGFVFRYLGRALVWYDELASIGLVWLTYFGSALAALKGAHIGVPALVNAMPANARVGVTLFAELCVFLFFGVLAVTGVEVLVALGNDRMVSLPWVPLRVTQSIIPIGAVLFILAEALRLPELLRDARRGNLIDTELREALEGAEVTQASLGAESRR
jgi:TRAP-type C4-dicarboxylate transport system permease small subunit